MPLLYRPLPPLTEEQEKNKALAKALIEASLQSDFKLDHATRLGGKETVFDFLPVTYRNTLRDSIASLLCGEISGVPIPAPSNADKLELFKLIVQNVNENLSSGSPMLVLSPSGKDYTLQFAPGANSATAAAALKAWKEKGAQNTGTFRGEYSAATADNVKAQELFIDFLKFQYPDAKKVGATPININVQFLQWMVKTGVKETDAQRYLDELAKPLMPELAPGVSYFTPRQIQDGRVPALIDRLYNGYANYLRNGAKLDDLFPDLINPLKNWKKWMAGAQTDAEKARLAGQAATMVKTQVALHPDAVATLLVAARLSQMTDANTHRQIFSSDLNRNPDVLVRTLSTGLDAINTQLNLSPAPISANVQVDGMVIPTEASSPVVPLDHGQLATRPYAYHFVADVKKVRPIISGVHQGGKYEPGLLNQSVYDATHGVGFAEAQARAMSSFETVKDYDPGTRQNTKTKNEEDIKRDPQLKAIIGKYTAQYPDAAKSIESFCLNRLLANASLELIYNDPDNSADLVRLQEAIYARKDGQVGKGDLPSAEVQSRYGIKIGDNALQMLRDYLGDPADPASPSMYATASATNELLKNSSVPIEAYRQMRADIDNPGNDPAKLDAMKIVYGVSRQPLDLPPSLQAAQKAGKTFKKADDLLIYNWMPGQKNESDFTSINEAVNTMMAQVGYEDENDRSSDGYKKLFVRKYGPAKLPLLPSYDPATNTFTKAILTGAWMSYENGIPVAKNSPKEGQQIFYYAATPEQEKQWNDFVIDRRGGSENESPDHPMTLLLEQHRRLQVVIGDDSRTHLTVTPPTKPVEAGETVDVPYQVEKIITPKSDKPGGDPATDGPIINMTANDKDYSTVGVLYAGDKKVAEVTGANGHIVIDTKNLPRISDPLNDEEQAAKRANGYDGTNRSLAEAPYLRYSYKTELLGKDKLELRAQNFQHPDAQAGQTISQFITGHQAMGFPERRTEDVNLDAGGKVTVNRRDKPAMDVYMESRATEVEPFKTILDSQYVVRNDIYSLMPKVVLHDQALGANGKIDPALSNLPDIERYLVDADQSQGVFLFRVRHTRLSKPGAWHVPTQLTGEAPAEGEPSYHIVPARNLPVVMASIAYSSQAQDPKKSTKTLGEKYYLNYPAMQVEDNEVKNRLELTPVAVPSTGGEFVFELRDNANKDATGQGALIGTARWTRKDRNARVGADEFAEPTMRMKYFNLELTANVGFLSDKAQRDRYDKYMITHRGGAFEDQDVASITDEYGAPNRDSRSPNEALPAYAPINFMTNGLDQIGVTSALDQTSPLYAARIKELREDSPTLPPDPVRGGEYQIEYKVNDPKGSVVSAADLARYQAMDLAKFTYSAAPPGETDPSKRLRLKLVGKPGSQTLNDPATGKALFKVSRGANGSVGFEPIWKTIHAEPKLKNYYQDTSSVMESIPNRRMKRFVMPKGKMG